MNKKLRLLIISDAHIPDRAWEIPNKILEWIERNRPFDIVLYAGDLTGEEMLNYVKSLGNKVYVVAGNMDYLDLPEYEVIEIQGLRIGLIHGDQVYPRGNIPKLTRIAKKLSVNILVSGHTHDPFIEVHEGILHLNPGSITGVPSGGGGSLIPSFMYVELYEDGLLNIELYELVEDVLKKTRSERLRIAPLRV